MKSNTLRNIIATYYDESFNESNVLVLKEKQYRMYAELIALSKKTVKFLKAFKSRVMPLEFTRDVDVSTLVKRIQHAIDNMEEFHKAASEGIAYTKKASEGQEFITNLIIKNYGKAAVILASAGTLYALSKNYLNYPINEAAYDEFSEMEDMADKLMRVPRKLHEVTQVMMAGMPPKRSLRGLERKEKKEVNDMDKGLKKLHELTNPWGELQTSFLNILLEIRKLKNDTKVYKS